MGEVVPFKLVISGTRKQEYSPYFYNMAGECAELISRRQENNPYALGVPREAVKQFAKKTVILHRSLRRAQAAEDIRRLLAGVNCSATFLQSKLGNLAFMPFQYSTEMEKLFTEMTSLLISMENRLAPVLMRSANVSSVQIK